MRSARKIWGRKRKRGKRQQAQNVIKTVDNQEAEEPVKPAWVITLVRS